MKKEINSIEIVEARKVSVSFGNKLILNDVSFAARSGDLIAVGGPSGGGKTTLLRVLNRLQEPDSGSVFFQAKPVAAFNVVKLRQRICYMQQTPVMVNGTARDNLLIPYSFKASATKTPPDDRMLVESMQRFQLSDISLHDNAQNLSVGQKQRLALIRTMLLEPDVLLLDEPTSALDARSREIVEKYIEDLVIDKGTTVIMVSHVDISFKNVEVRKFNINNGILMEIAQ
ncbi:MAG: ATP-binding cassette domain-containing protein [Rubrobacteridae bacterium]|nr:ATP-binding cassette domain-containing protein [Rubrobacteridae bacterium]